MSVLLLFGNRDKRQVKNLPNRSYYRTLIDYKPEPCLLTDFEGDILLINPAFTSLSGYNEDEIVGLPLKALVWRLKGEINQLHAPVLREFRQPCFLLAETGFLLSVELVFNEIEGQKYLAEFSLLASEIKENKVATEKPISHTATQPPQLVSIQNQEVNLKDDLNISDLRTLISGLDGTLRLLGPELENMPDNIHKQYETLLRTTDRMKKLVDNVDEFTGKQEQSMRIELLDLEQIVVRKTTEYQPLAKETGMRVNVRVATTSKVLADESVLNAAMDWLLQKAMRYCRSEQVEIRAEEDKPNGLVALVVDNIGLELSAALSKQIQQAGLKPDNSLMQQLNAYDPLFAAAFQNAVKSGIRWDFAFKPPSQMVVRLLLESTLDNSPESAVKQFEQKLKKHNLTILIVEDDRINAKVLEQYLKNAADVMVAYSGNEALNLLEFHLPDKPLHAVLMDITLPQPWNGISLRNEMLSRWSVLKNCLFLAQTALSGSGLQDGLRNQGFIEVLRKPVDKIHLLKTLLENIQNKHS